MPAGEGINGARRFKATEFDSWLDRLLGGPLIRDDIDVDLWRALPASPNA